MCEKKFLILFGPSGSGKSVVKEYLENRGFNKLVSDTSRKIRDYAGEIEDVSYHFKTKEEFLDGIKNNKYIEFTNYSGEFYGVSKEEFENALNENGSICHVMDVKGVKYLKSNYPNDVVTVFLMAPKNELAKRMNGRGDSPKSIDARLSTYDDEIKNSIYADEVIENSQLELTFSKIDYVVSKYFGGIIDGISR